MGNGSFDSDSVKFANFRIALANAKTEEEKALDRELEWRESSEYAPKQLDKTKIVDMNGSKFALYGYRPKAKKMPFIMRNLKTEAFHICTTEVAEEKWGVA